MNKFSYLCRFLSVFLKWLSGLVNIHHSMNLPLGIDASGDTVMLFSEKNVFCLEPSVSSGIDRSRIFWVSLGLGIDWVNPVIPHHWSVLFRHHFWGWSCCTEFLGGPVKVRVNSCWSGLTFRVYAFQMISNGTNEHHVTHMCPCYKNVLKFDLWYIVILKDT